MFENAQAQLCVELRPIVPSVFQKRARKQPSETRIFQLSHTRTKSRNHFGRRNKRPPFSSTPRQDQSIGMVCMQPFADQIQRLALAFSLFAAVREGTLLYPL